MNVSTGLRIFILFALLCAQMGCAVPGNHQAESTYFPDTTWRMALPEEQGINSQGIIDMLDVIAEKELPIHSFLLIRGGYLVSEVYFDPYGQDYPQFLYSATKSVLSALVGIAIADGLIQGTGQKVLDFFPDRKDLNQDPLLAGLTIEHLLTMTAGIETFVSPGPSEAIDWTDEYLTQSFTSRPGHAFFYNSGAPHVLAAILQQTTGKMLQEYAREKLFLPLGIREQAWLADSNGINFGNSWLKLRPLDMAKIGYLYIHKGKWNGQQIIPAKWVDRSTRNLISTQRMTNAAEENGYGYYWWMNSFGGYAAHGFGGQYIFVVPELDLVAVFTGAFDDPSFATSYELMKAYIIPAVQSSAALPKNDPNAAALAESIASFGALAEYAPVSLPETARQVSGKTYVLSANSSNMKDMTFFFEDGSEFKAVSSSEWGGETIKVPYVGGLGGAYRLNPLGEDLGLGTSAIRGVWEGEQTFVVEDFKMDTFETHRYHFKFDGDILWFLVEVYRYGNRVFTEVIVGNLPE